MEGMEGANDICLRLWCISPDNPDGCITRGGLAALYGTPCGGDKVRISLSTSLYLYQYPSILDEEEFVKTIAINVFPTGLSFWRVHGQ